MGVLGIVQTSGIAMNSTIYSVLFDSDKSAALSTATGLLGLGKAIAFVISTHICNTVYLIFLLSVAYVATVLYFTAEVIHMRKATKQ